MHGFKVREMPVNVKEPKMLYQMEMFIQWIIRHLAYVIQYLYHFRAKEKSTKIIKEYINNFV